MAGRQSKGSGGARETSANPASKTRGWYAISDKATAAQQAAQHVDELQNLTAGRIRQFNSNVETYNAPERGAFGAYGGYRSGYRSGRNGGINKQQLALPACWSVIQALASELLTSEPAPQFLTSGGDYKARKESELLTNLTSGVAYSTGLDAIRPDVFIDACVGGTGFLYADRDPLTGKIAAERVFPPEIVSDPNDDIYAYPRSLYRVKFIDRDVLAQMFPKADKSKLKTAKTLSGLLTVGNAAQTNMVKVYWCWHLPSGPKATDGRRVICTSNDNLDDSEYKRDRFPIIPFRYDKGMMGFQGRGICEMVGAVQQHANELLLATQQSMQRHGVPHWLVHTNSFVNKQELNDLIGSIIYWSGQQKPELVSWESMPPDVMQMIEFDLDQIYKMTGVSLMAASAMKPAGLDSGEAIRAYVDTNSKRFQALGKDWERWHVQVYRWFAMLAREIAAAEGSYPVRVLRKRGQQHSLDVMDWKTARDSKEDDWQIECFPVSSLPKTPSGKLQYVKDLAEIGPDVIAGLDIVELLEIPDTTSFLRLELAGRRLAEKLVADILDDGRYRAPPENCLPLDWALKHVSQVLAQAQIENAPKDRIELLLMWQAQVVDQQQANAGPPPGPLQPPVPSAAALAPAGPAALAPAALPAPAPQAPLAPVAQPGQ